MQHYSFTEFKNFGYYRVAGATPELKVADVDFNLGQHLEMIDLAAEEQIDLLVFPRFSLTGISCGDLFRQKTLLTGAATALRKISRHLQNTNLTALLTIPHRINSRLYQFLCVLSANSCESYILPTSRNSALADNFYFDRNTDIWSADNYPVLTPDCGIQVGTNGKRKAGAEKLNISIYQSISEFLQNHLGKEPSSNLHLILSDNPELADHQLNLQNQLASAAELSEGAVLYLQPPFGESSTDFVYSGKGYIFERDLCLAKTNLYESDLMIADLDLDFIGSVETAEPDASEEQRDAGSSRDEWDVEVSQDWRNSEISQNQRSSETSQDRRDSEKEDIYSYEIYRPFPKDPFLPNDPQKHPAYFESVLNIASHGLAKRLRHVGTPKIILGLSGGLDSTLALLIAIRAERILQHSNQNILCISMPGFGTTPRTFNNAKNLAYGCQANYLEISIHDAVGQHFKDIDQDPNKHDTTYENAQARERTQILMDLANQRGGLVIGTGDLSEAALGFTTYGGDHLSMYQVNAGIPKTLIRHLIKYEARRFLKEEVAHNTQTDFAKSLFDILETPVSPELLPPADGQISQKTEHIIGPYELHDFFIYYFMKYQLAPRKLLFIAEQAFQEEYDSAEILHWLRLFYKRFFANQFKRSAMPDGPAVTEISFSPRKSLKMPSDANVALWLKDLED